MIDSLFLLLKRYIPRKVFLFFQPMYHWCLAWFAAALYGFPSRRLIVIGVTGTKGKTSVVELARPVLEATGASVATLSSLRFCIGDREVVNTKKMTTPGRFFIQKFLYQSAQAGVKYAVIEMTSEGIRQFRHRFIDFDVVLMTNVAPEHIESHGTFEKYLRAKLDLFLRLKPTGTAIVNGDDFLSPRFTAATRAKKIIYSKNRIVFSDRTFSIHDADIAADGITFDMHRTQFSSPLLGETSFYNLLAVVSIGISQHMALAPIAAALKNISSIPGRMEFVQREPYAVVVDYAHTPDSLVQLYNFFKKQGVYQRMICVLGAAGGGRDAWKRPVFGSIASQSCDLIFLTDEDPYNEDPEKILNDIEKGITDSSRPVRKILDRRQAIHEALASAQPKDIVVITGKGAEQCIMGPDGAKTPWDDRSVVREEIILVSKHI